MPPAGDNIFERWREAGEWWSGEPQREILRYFDTNGIRREEQKVLPSLGNAVKASIPIDRVSKSDENNMSFVSGVVAETDYSDVPPLKKIAPYTLLHALSSYSFGQSAMLVNHIPAYHRDYGYQAMLLADRFSLMGVFEFQKIAIHKGIKPLFGATLEMADGGELVLVAKTPRGYRNLSRLISECHLQEPRLFPLCTWERLARHAEDLLCLTGGHLGVVNRHLVRRDTQAAHETLDRLIGLYCKGNVFVQIERSLVPWEMHVNQTLLDLAESLRLTPVAGGPITHPWRGAFAAQDTLVCVESLCLIEEVIGRKPRRAVGQPDIPLPPQRFINGERFLPSPPDLEERFADRPDLLRNTLKIAELCEDKILPGRVNLPKFCPNEKQTLYEVTYAGLRQKGLKLDKKRYKRIEYELARIAGNGFESHFLVAWDMCRWANDQGIVSSGRGSVVDSAVAYCLGISRIDAMEHNLHFDRFLPADASKRPDIDIDFEARRRDDVRNYLSDKYGRDHVATVAAFGTYRTRGIVREVGKVMGIPEENMSYLAKRLHGSVSPDELEREIEAKPELRDSNIPRERFHWVFQLANYLMDLPRNVRSHSSGVVISEQPICDTVPVMVSGAEGVQIIQWDKRSSKKCFDKFDVLCLRGHDVLSKLQEQVREDEPEFSVNTLPLDNEEEYRTMRAGELIGIPQSASPAMRQAHMRIKTKNLKEASIVQAGIRPGVGGAVKLNELIARKAGKAYDFPHPDLEKILDATYGIVVFQEQIDQLLTDMCGYKAAQAEEVREGVYKQRQYGYIEKIQEDIFKRLNAKGYSNEVAQIVYDLVAQFKGYGFAEGHALAFADISVRSIYCQQNYPAPYFAALLQAQPAGYYPSSTIANEARIRGVKILSPDVNRSGLEFLVEDYQAEDDPKLIFPKQAIRTSLGQLKGLSKPTRERLVEQRGTGQFTSFFDFTARVRPHRDELERLILSGALDSLHPNRRRLLWAIPSALQYMAVFENSPGALPLHLPEPHLPKAVKDFADVEKAIHERTILEMDVEQHLLAFERPRVQKKGAKTAAEASHWDNPEKIFVVGNPIRLRFPPTSSGKRVMFFDLEDETGLLNVTCFTDTYDRDGQVVICSPYVTVWGVTQNRDDHIAFMAQRIFPYKPVIERHRLPDELLPLVMADFLHG